MSTAKTIHHEVDLKQHFCLNFILFTRTSNKPRVFFKLLPFSSMTSLIWKSAYSYSKAYFWFYKNIVGIFGKHNLLRISRMASGNSIRQKKSSIILAFKLDILPCQCLRRILRNFLSFRLNSESNSVYSETRFYAILVDRVYSAG